MSDEEETETVVCETHGETAPRYACRHVSIGIACGWHDGGADDNGWCDYCEQRLVAAGDWTPELAKELKLLCTHCFAEARDANRRVPGALTGFGLRLTEDEQGELFQAGIDHTKALQKQAQARWDFGRDSGRWDFDDETRTVTFSEGGTPFAIADARMVGSYSTNDGSFQWSWVLYGPDDPLIREVVGMRAFGEIRGIERLTTRHWHGEIEEAWEMAALAAYLIKCDAVYRAPFDDGLYWFMLLDNFRYPA
jgi:hypothetical protein